MSKLGSAVSLGGQGTFLYAFSISGLSTQVFFPVSRSGKEKHVALHIVIFSCFSLTTLLMKDSFSGRDALRTDHNLLACGTAIRH